MGLPVFPQDVFDEIISQLTDEIFALKSCSLVCRSFRRKSQKMLFNYETVVVLAYDLADWRDPYKVIGPWQQPINLVLIVKHAPHLIEYIQELRISCSSDIRIPVFDASDTADIANALGVFSRKGEFPINLRSLSLEFDNLRWDSITDWVQDALVLLTSADSLRHITLDGILNYPIEFFQNQNHPLLKHLSLKNTTFSSLRATQKELPKLESLKIRFMMEVSLDQFATGVECIVNTTQLKTFEGDGCTPLTLPVLEQILRPTSNSLEYLTLREFNIPNPDSVSINLNRFSRLTDIAIYQRISARIPPILVLITKTMKNVSHRNVIQNLLFHLEIGTFNIADFELATKDVWQEMDTIWSIPQLVSSESFHGITFSIQSTAHNCDALSDLLQNKLPETKKASKLHIKTSPFG